MKTATLKLSAIGNSRGVRLPAGVIRRYGFDGAIIAELREDGVLLKPAGGAPSKLSWDATARAMCEAGEDWSEWTAVDADGLAGIPWRAKRGSARPARR